MPKLNDHQKKIIESGCQWIMENYPNSIAIALMVLDCGCMKVSGISSTGDPLGTTMLLLGQPVEIDKKTKKPIAECPKCLADGGNNKRIIDRALEWPVNANALPPEEYRVKIARKVFGSSYEEGEVELF